MAIRNLLDDGLSFDETIPINFQGISQPFNFSFTRDGDIATIAIPTINFTLSQQGLLQSTTKIPSQYIPSIGSMSWIIMNDGNYKPCNITVYPTGLITISNGPAGANFQPFISYSTNNNQFHRYLV